LGKPYIKDLDSLLSTARWAESVDVSALSTAIGRKSSFPLLAIGSGGSQSVACFAAMVHRHYTHKAAEETTPLLSIKAGVTGRAVQIFTASGANPDVLGCFSQMVVEEPEEVTVLSSASSSPLSDRAAMFSFTEYFGFDGPFEGEGFVATNSILAQVILLKRSYEQAFGNPSVSVVGSLENPVTESWLLHLEASLKEIGSKQHLVVLFNELGKPAAIDFESKFSEVGLASVQLADFRNFAHGRHNWIDKHLLDTLVVSIEVGSESVLASRTLRLLPPVMPTLRVSVAEEGHVGSVIAMFAVMRLTGIFGSLRGLDPGRPGVPSYGSKLYRLNAWPSRNLKISIPEISIVRKSRQPLEDLRRSSDIDLWMEHLTSFTKALGAVKFDALAIDYDGTLCDQRDRLKGICVAVAGALASLLRSNVPILVITGRGRSVGMALRNAISKSKWDLIRVAYYNGSEIRPLSFDGALDSAADPNRELSLVIETLKTHPRLRGLVIEARRSQVTVAATAALPPLALHSLISDLLSRNAGSGLTAVTSAHSVDILASGISKRNPIRLDSPKQNYLCVGDSGEWPGNDYDLLQEPGSLSSHRTSQRLDSCWHISSPGSRNAQSTLHYLSCLQAVNGGFGVNVERLVTGRG
jgi:hydroxymethylpyrimidine pyrophosphatase-like HAD family hydrolase